MLRDLPEPIQQQILDLLETDFVAAKELRDRYQKQKAFPPHQSEPPNLVIDKNYTFS